jgi:hypothetical protein
MIYSSIPLQTTLSFLWWLNSVPLCICTTHYLPIQQLMVTDAVSISWLLYCNWHGSAGVSSTYWFHFFGYESQRWDSHVLLFLSLRRLNTVSHSGCCSLPGRGKGGLSLVILCSPTHSGCSLYLWLKGALQFFLLVTSHLISVTYFSNPLLYLIILFKKQSLLGYDLDMIKSTCVQSIWCTI